MPEMVAIKYTRECNEGVDSSMRKTRRKEFTARKPRRKSTAQTRVSGPVHAD